MHLGYMHHEYTHLLHYGLDILIMDTSIMGTCILDACIMDTCITDTFIIYKEVLVLVKFASSQEGALRAPRLLCTILLTPLIALVIVVF